MGQRLFNSMHISERAACIEKCHCINVLPFLASLGHACLSQLLPKQCHCVSCDSLLAYKFRPTHFHVLKVIMSLQYQLNDFDIQDSLTAFEHHVICAICNSYSCKSPSPRHYTIPSAEENSYSPPLKCSWLDSLPPFDTL